MNRTRLLALLHTLSLSRLGFAVLFVLAPDDPTRVALALASGLTDVLDGWLARRWDLTTPVGAVLDPACDRAFVVTAVVTLTVEGRLSPIAAGLLLLRDALTVVAWLTSRLVVAWRGLRFQARLAGKLVTLLQFITLLAVLLWPASVPVLVTLTGVLAAAAVVDYARNLQQRTRPPVPPFPPAGQRPLARQG